MEQTVKVCGILHNLVGLFFSTKELRAFLLITPLVGSRQGNTGRAFGSFWCLLHSANSKCPEALFTAVLPLYSREWRQILKSLWRCCQDSPRVNYLILLSQGLQELEDGGVPPGNSLPRAESPWPAGEVLQSTHPFPAAALTGENDKAHGIFYSFRQGWTPAMQSHLGAICNYLTMLGTDL